MLAEGVIEPTISAWNFPLFMVPQKDGGSRPVVDYRRLNKLCKPEKFPLPLLQDIIASIGTKNRVFTTLDMASGYWQITLDDVSKELTAFSAPSWHWQFRKMPFGISGAPLTFQRLVNSVVHGLLGKSVFAFFDDIVLVSEDVPSNLHCLEEVLRRFRDAGLTLKLSKCHFLRKEIRYLGYVLNSSGIQTTSDKIASILKFPTPRDVKAVRSFLGLSGFYRSFIQSYSTIARPLAILLRKEAQFTWGTEQQQAFDKLKKALTSQPVLSYPDFNKPFYLYTDASLSGLGAALMQYDDRSKLQPLGYASRVLNAAESNYSVTHLEALGVVWAFKHFKELIYGYPIHVRTDHAPIVELFKAKSFTGKLARWALTVQDFQPTFAHVPGVVSICRCDY